MKEIENYIENYLGIGGRDLSPVAQLFQETQISKNEFILRINQYSNSLSFVKQGYLRVYAYSENGDKEVTQWIAMPGMFITDLSSFVFGSQSRWNIQALTNVEMYTISKEKYDTIGDYVDNWSELDKLFIAKCFVALENRVFAQLSMTSEQKVRNLLEINPVIFNEVPLQYLASMLGMTPETMSRVRKKMSS